MKQIIIALLFVIPGVGFAADITVRQDEQNKLLTIDNGSLKYVFRTTDNKLMNIVCGTDGKNLLSTIPGGGARWIYLTQEKQRKAFRQGEVKGPASHDIIRSDDGPVKIQLHTRLSALQIEEVYVFETNGGITHTYEIEAVESIPAMQLFCWEAKLGISAELLEPFDNLAWGKGPATLRNEKQFKTAGQIRGPMIKLSNKRAWAACCWLKPSDLEERFIALQNSKTGDYWMLAFEEDGQQPWFFLGDSAKGNTSEWIGFRVFGQHVFSPKMPTFHIDKGTKWSGTIGHIISNGKRFEDLSAAYNQWLNNQ